MTELSTLLRAMQLYAHMAHHSVSGVAFFIDHEKLGEFYESYSEAYDSLIERIIGLYGLEHLDLLTIQINAVDKLKTLPMRGDTNSVFFDAICQLESELCKIIDELNKHPNITVGAQNLIAQLADDSEKRQYLLKARTK